MKMVFWHGMSCYNLMESVVEMFRLSQTFCVPAMPRGPYRKVSNEGRQRIWDAWTDPVNPKSMAEIARQEGLSKATVQGVIEAMRKIHANIPLKKRGRKAKLTKSYVFPAFLPCSSTVCEPQVVQEVGSFGQEESILRNQKTVQ